MSILEVIIVGAGISGLYAARTIQKQGIRNFQVLEASHKPGGRLQLMDGLPIDSGGEFVHGEKDSLLKRFFQEQGWNFEQRGWPNWWWFAKEKKWVGPEEENEGIKQALHWIARLESVDISKFEKQDQTAYQFLRAKGATDVQLEIVDCFVQDFGCSIKEASMLELKNENDHYPDGDDYLILDRPMYSVVEALVREVRNIKYNFPVSKIDSSNPSFIEVHGPNGTVLRTKRVIITVSLNVLKSNLITFVPPLPKEKREAMHRLKMNNIIKVIFVFSERIWPNNGMWDVCCPGGFVQELWMKEVRDNVTKEPRYVVTCYFAGNKVFMRTKEEADAGIAKCLQQLDEMFSTPEKPKIASNHMIRVLVEDYSSKPYILGGHVYPTFGARLNDREILGKPVENRLFFAGEAVHPHVNPTIQAAMLMGEEAATKAVISLKSSKL